MRSGPPDIQLEKLVSISRIDGAPLSWGCMQYPKNGFIKIYEKRATSALF